MRRRSKPFHKRWHGDAINGYSRLTLEERGAYTTILDQMYDHGGPVRDEDRLCCAWLNCDVRVWKRLRAALVDQHAKLRSYTDLKGVRWLVNDRAQSELGLPTYAELVANFGDKFAIANVELSAKSAKKTKENNATASREGTENLSPIPLPLPDNPQTPEPGAGQARQDAEVRSAFDMWNETAAACGLPAARDLTDSRRRNIARRLQTGGLQRWQEALRAVEVSKLCRGQKTDWKADLDFVCQAKSFQKLIEGAYGVDAPAPPARREMTEDDWRTAMELWRSYGDWLPRFGPAPGTPGCRVPTHLILAEATAAVAGGAA